MSHHLRSRPDLRLLWEAQTLRVVGVDSIAGFG
jgi:hypothetical protein